ncbi:MAG: hybrid sensor histidine kinase/response regulator [Rubrimonas sp.]|uniref:sensor histidine kinase n=1 Tax=Rubrimonas sp. TaxID=2036015 RepID=UPI002FDCB020
MRSVQDGRAGPPGRQARAAPRDLSVAVVDDSAEDRALIRDLLRKLPHYRVDVFAVASYRAARDALSARRFDIALIDRRLDEGDAFQLARALGGAAAASPLVLMTSAGDAALEDEAAQAGFLDFLDKSERSAVTVERTLRYAMAAHARERALAAALARARAAEIARTAFVARLSHDLRGPLGGVLGFAEMIESGRVAPDDAATLHDYAGSIAACARQCLGLVEELLAQRVAEEEATRDGPPRDADAPEIDAGAALREGLDALAPDAARFGVALRISVEPDPLTARIPAQTLRRIALNLADNALRYAAQTVEVRLTAEADRLSLEVRDDGPGVAEDALTRLGAPLARGDQRGRRGARGHGLGLASVRALAEARGGALGLRSAPGEGLTATVTLPRR